MQDLQSKATTEPEGNFHLKLDLIFKAVWEGF